MSAAARWLVLLALCLITFFFRLGAPAITDSDEAYYAEAGREMIESGDWVTPHFNYEPRLEKPVLFYWLIASTYKIAGVGEAQARLFAALAGVGLVWVACLVGRRWVGPPQGLLAGAIVATSFGVFWMARSALPDLPLAFFLTLGTWAGIEAISPDASRSRWWLFTFAICISLAFLTKGPIAFAVPAVVLAGVWLWEWRTAKREGSRFAMQFGVLDIILALGIMAVLIVPWLVLITRAHPEYLRRMFFTENLERFATPKYNAFRPGFYIPVMLADLAPWSAFLVLWIEPGWRWVKRQRPLSRLEARLLIWAGAPFALFSVSIGSQPRYILPCLVPLAVLLARTIRARALQAPVTRQRVFSVAGVLAGLTIVAIAILLHGFSAFKIAYPNYSSTWSTWTIVGGSLVIIAALQASRRIAEVIAVASIVMLIALLQTLTPARPEAVEVASAPVVADQPDIVCACGAFGRNLTLYTRHQVVAGASKEEIRDVLTRSERVYAAVDSKMLPVVEGMTGRTYRRVLEVPYLNLGELQVKSLVPMFVRHAMERLAHLDQERTVQNVILVSNR